MATYAIGDIHGCYDDFISMLDMIDFKVADDSLILLGDYIDRGSKSYEMIEWLLDNDFDAVFLRGNHEEEFIEYINLLNTYYNNSNKMSLLDYCTYLHEKSFAFDYYGTVRNLIKYKGFSLKELNQWVSFFKSLPLYFKTKVNGSRYILAHAGYIEDNDGLDEKTRKEFLLYAREENLQFGGVSNSNIIAGHTPTILSDEFAYNNGNVFKYEMKDLNCIYYNIDCGCVFKYDEKDNENAKLACMRLDDNAIFYK